jgi:hypothetical protein
MALENRANLPLEHYAVSAYILRSQSVSRAPSNFRQEDVKRAIKAARSAGLEIVRVEVDPKTAKIVVVVKNEDATETKVNPFDSAPVHDPAMRKRKSKTPC